MNQKLASNHTTQDKVDRLLADNSSDCASLENTKQNLYSRLKLEQEATNKSDLLDQILILELYSWSHGCEKYKASIELASLHYEKAKEKDSVKNFNELKACIINDVFNVLERLATIKAPAEALVQFKRWTKAKFELLVQDVNCSDSQTKASESLLALFNIPLEDFDLRKNLWTRSLSAYRIIANQVFLQATVSEDKLQTGLSSLSLEDNLLPNWLNEQGARVLNDFDLAQADSRIGTAVAAISLALRETKGKKLESLISKACSVLGFSGLREENEQLRKEVLKALVLANTASLDPTAVELQNVDSNQILADCKDKLRKIASNLGLSAQYVENYDYTLPLSHETLNQLVTLQQARLAKKNRSAGLKDVYQLDQLKDWQRQKGIHFQLAFDGDQLIMASILILDSNKFPSYLKDFIKENPQIDSDKIGYVVLMVSSKDASDTIRLDSGQLAFQAAKNLSFSYSKSGIIGWAREDNPMLEIVAGQGARILSKAIPIIDNGCEFKAIFQLLSLPDGKLSHWSKFHEVEVSKQVRLRAKT